MGIDQEEDLKRKMIELNLRAALNSQSAQTGYIHLNYDEANQQHDTIPSLENFSFALALFRSRLTEKILEGKALLEKLLPFEVDGNFPIYLHEFPQCKDRSLSLSLLPIFHWILADFKIALGEPLITNLETLIGRILSHGYKMHSNRPLSKPAEFRLKSYVEPNAIIPWTPSTPEEFASALISVQISPVQTFHSATLADTLWHPQLCTFTGPQQQDRAEPKVTLLDLILGHAYGSYSSRALKDRRTHLLASLVFPIPLKTPTCLKIPYHSISDGALHPYTLYWGTPDQLHSLTLSLQQSHCSIEKKEGTVEFTITLSTQALQPKDEEFELALFVDADPSHEILVQGDKATTFQLQDLINIRSDQINLQVEFLLEQGDGSFFGHISKGNRPSQKGQNLKYEAYDWRIALRTIRRTQECRIKIRLKEMVAKTDYRQPGPSHACHCQRTE